jgi:hypothetical protein
MYKMPVFSLLNRIYSAAIVAAMFATGRNVTPYPAEVTGAFFID